ncbi:MAG: ABC transporter permease [Clostridiales bacterium]|nr:ABC transporter permease [Clostridiales bacterium]
MNLNGTGKVFKFTITQQLKSRTFRITTIVILVISILIAASLNIIPALISKDDGEKAPTLGDIDVKEVYVLDESGLNIDIVSALSAEMPKANIVKLEQDEESIIDELVETTESKILLKLTKDESGYSILSIKPPNITVDKDDLTLYYTKSIIESGRLLNAGVSEADVEMLLANISAESIEAGEEVKSLAEILTEIYVPMASGIILFLLIYLYGYWVATSIVAEKSSRVMELLLTSVKPLAVVLGKLIAMGTLALTQFALLLASAGISYKISGGFANSMAGENYNPLDLSTLTDAFTPLNIIVVLIIFILGYILYAEMNAIAGATISSAEDMQMAVMPVNFIAIVGFYLSYFSPAVDNDVLNTIVALCPISSPFALPTMIIMDKISIGMALASILILIATIVIVLLFAARVYSSIVLHTGNRLRLKDLFSIYRQK